MNTTWVWAGKCADALIAMCGSVIVCCMSSVMISFEELLTPSVHTKYGVQEYLNNVCTHWLHNKSLTFN